MMDRGNDMKITDEFQSTLSEAKGYMEAYPRAVNISDRIIRRLVVELEKCDAQNKALIKERDAAIEKEDYWRRAYYKEDVVKDEKIKALKSKLDNAVKRIEGI